MVYAEWIFYPFTMINLLCYYVQAVSRLKGGAGMVKYKHLTLDERVIIESMLAEKKSLSSIARELNRSLSTISSEIKSKRITEKKGAYITHRPFNDCRKRFHCSMKGLCSPCCKSLHPKLCRTCNLCTVHCDQYEKETCTRLLKPPYVCNSCGQIGFCTLEKFIYHAKEADVKYHKILCDSRTGVTYSEEDLLYLDSVITPLVKQGQSPHHICLVRRDEIDVSESTIYRMIESQLISAKNIDLPRKVRFRKRKKKIEKKVDKACRIGRTYEDFQKFMAEHPDTSVVQIDSVEGVKGGKCLLTIHFVKTQMMLAFLRDHNSSSSVADIFNMLYEGLEHDQFKAVFPVILTDNGTEFSNPKAIEFAPDGRRRTYVFYCDPLASQQKGSAERNHEFIRLFIPKGKDFGIYSQSHITCMMNHINSYSREGLGNKCPFDVFSFFYGSSLIDLTGGFRIPSDKVTLNSSVFKELKR